jgi:hypothetical protein
MDGCSQQYQSRTMALILLTLILTVTHGIILDHTMGAPGHGNGEADGLNAIDKQCLAMKMSQATMLRWQLLF